MANVLETNWKNTGQTPDQVYSEPMTMKEAEHSRYGLEYKDCHIPKIHIYIIIWYAHYTSTYINSNPKCNQIHLNKEKP